jgi:hypothetical protein
LIFYWLLLRPRVRERQLVSHFFGKFRAALQKKCKGSVATRFFWERTRLARWLESPASRCRAALRRRRAETTLTVWTGLVVRQGSTR